MTAIASRARLKTRPAPPDWALPIVGVGSVLVLFEVLSRTELISSRHFPPISEMAAALVDLLGQSGFWTSVWHTLEGWALGLGVAMAIAVPAGIVIGSTPLLYRALRGVIEFLRPIPSVALIPLAVLVWEPASRARCSWRRSRPRGPC